MAELTKEWLKQTIAEYEANRDELPFGLDTNRAIELQAFKLALASLEADPVAYIFKHPAGKLFWALTDESNKEQADVIPVYAAPPVPVVPAALPENDDEDGHDIDYLEPSEVYALGRTAGWNACRAAMLYGAVPASQTYKLNEMSGNSPVIPDGWISCSERMPNEEDVLVYCSDTKEQMVGFHKGKGLFQFFYMNGVEGVIRNAPDVPEQFISVKLIRFALSLYPVMFIVYGHYPAKFMTEHSLSNMRLDIHLGQTCNKRSSEIMCSPVTQIHPSPYSIYESVGCSDADRFVYVFSREKNIIVRCHGLFEKRLNLFEDWTADNITHLAMLFRYGPYVVQQVKFCLCCQPKL